MILLASLPEGNGQQFDYVESRPVSSFSATEGKLILDWFCFLYYTLQSQGQEFQQHGGLDQVVQSQSSGRHDDYVNHGNIHGHVQTNPSWNWVYTSRSRLNEDNYAWILAARFHFPIVTTSDKVFINKNWLNKNCAMLLIWTHVARKLMLVLDWDQYDQ